MNTPRASKKKKKSKATIISICGHEVKVLFNRNTIIYGLGLLLVLTVFGSTIHVMHHHVPDHQPLPQPLLASRALQPTQRRQDWQNLNHFSLTFLEQRTGISICPSEFRNVDTAEDCEAAAYHLRREFKKQKKGSDCVLYTDEQFPQIVFGNWRRKRDYQLICQSISPPSSSQSFIGYHRKKQTRAIAAVNEDAKKREDDRKKDEEQRKKEEKKKKEEEQKKKEKQKTTRDPKKPKPLEKKWHLLEYEDGEHDPKFKYVGHGWCTSGKGRRIKLRKTHWMSHPGRKDFSMEFCEKLCLEEAAPICAGYVVNISFGRVVGFQCDILNVLDNEYFPGGITDTFEDDAAERHCWMLDEEHRPKYKTREEGIIAAPPRPSPDERAEGILLARHYNSHCRHLWGAKHWTDSIASSERRTLYVTNVKSGSMSIRHKFFMLRAGFFTSPLPVSNIDAKYQCGRMSTGVWSSEDIYKERLQVFSWVRDPVKKFESGVRQAWFHDGSLENITADAMLDMVLGDGTVPQGNTPVKNCGRTHNLEFGWVNEHLQPSSWRLTGESHDRKHLEFTFIGKLEYMNRDWNELLTRIEVDKEEEYLLPLLEEKMWNKNPREKDPKSILSPEAIRKMCKSERYRREWACFQYDPPPECADIDMSII